MRPVGPAGWLTNRSRAFTVTGIASMIALVMPMLVPFSVVGQVDKANVSAIGVLRTLGSRKMGTREYNRRVHDNIGAVFALRLRYEAPVDHGIYVYAPNGSMPFGYSLERTGESVHWITGKSTDERSKSPGFARLRNQFGDGWLFLPAGSALEWDVVVVRTNPGCQDSKSIFVKKRTEDEPLEVFSTWFTTPVSPDFHGVSKPQ